MNREAIYTALFNLAKTATGITYTSRFLQPIDSVATANLPALFQRQVSDDPKNDKGIPAVLTLEAELYIYVVNAGDGLDNSSSAPAIQLNNYLDNIDAALLPDPVTQVQTLGGLVSHCWRTSTNYFEDPITGKAALAIGIEMLTEGDSSTAFGFDSGTVYVLDSNGTPQILGSLQEISISQKFDTNKQRGNFQYDFKANRVSTKISAKAKFAQIKGSVLAQIVNGQTVSTGSQRVQSLEAHTIPGTPYQITVTPPSGSYSLDMGVIYDGGGSKGQALIQVPSDSSPSQGQYSVSGAVYTFAAADTGIAVCISYLYTATTGKSMTISNPYSGPSPTFRAVLNSTDKNGNQVVWNLPVCYSDQLDYVTRLEDFTIPEFSFSVMGTSDNPPVIGTFSYSQ